MLHPIRYIVMMGDRPDKRGLVIVEKNLVSHKLFSIGLLPHCFEHLVAGCDYYQNLMLTGEYVGLNVFFLYNDSLDNFTSTSRKLGENGCIVFVVNTTDSRCLDKISSFLAEFKGENDAIYIEENQSEWFKSMEVCRSTDDVVSHLVKIAPKFIDINRVWAPYCIPLLGREIDRGYMFNPSCVNTQTSQAMLGNWSFPLNIYSQEDRSQEMSNAIMEAKTFNRQGLLVEQIKRMNVIENESIRPLGGYPFMDQVKAPLVMVFPFTNSDIRNSYKGTRVVEEEENILQRHLNYVLSQNTDPNYTHGISLEDCETYRLDPRYVGIAYYSIYHNRSHFLDIASLLHCSLRFSPYIRFPFSGMEINKELAFAAPKLSLQLVRARDKRSVENVMTKIGDRIARNAIGDEAKEMLVKNNRQIVAITDLPVEWIPIEGVPLGFSHDICRIPEFPMEGILMNYVAASVDRVSIPKDIMERTLVVYGTKEPNFKKYQTLCDEFGKKLGFKARYCLTSELFYKTVKELKPLLLIVDTHGDYDAEKHQTYMYMGDDKVYPQDLVDNKISVPLVFLSACNTAPAYHSVNTLANGFIQSGSISVTSSYMPLDVDESSVLYLRLLTQLSQACKGRQHKNWLAFVSHILRTSIIHAAFRNCYEIDQKNTASINLEDPRITFLTESMRFPKRRETYGKLKSGVTIDGVNVSLNNKIPHYLMYTTIGRADLVIFDSYKEMIKDALMDSEDSSFSEVGHDGE